MAGVLERYFESFGVTWDPEFPGSDGLTFSLFQIVFPVGPGEDDEVSAEVHERFRLLLTLFAPLPEVQRADHVVLRARRHVSPPTDPDSPEMFVACSWTGAAVANMLRGDDFSSWHDACVLYRNHFNERDTLNKDEGIEFG